MSPVVAAGVPDHLAALRQHAPVGRVVAGLVERLDRLLQHLAHLARLGVGHPERRPLVVARRRHEEDARRVRAPFDVGPAPAADHVVADARPVRVGRHAEPDHARAARRVEVDHDPVDPEDHAVLGERVLPRLQPRVPDVRRDEVHLAHAAGIVLERRDPARVRRPEQDRPVALRPAGVVRRVAEVLDAVRGQPRLLARLEVADPEVVVADERGAPAVRGDDAIARRPVAATGRGVAAVAAEVAGVRADREDDRDGSAVAGELDVPQRQGERRVRRVRRRRERRGQPFVVERPPPRPPGRVDQHVLGPLREPVAVPEPVAVDPGRAHGRAVDEPRDVLWQKPLGAGVVVGRERRRRVRLLGEARRGGERDQEYRDVSHTILCIGERRSEASGTASSMGRRGDARERAPGLETRDPGLSQRRASARARSSLPDGAASERRARATAV